MNENDMERKPMLLPMCVSENTTWQELEAKFPNIFYQREPGYHVHPAREKDVREMYEGFPVFAHNEFTDPDFWYLITDGMADSFEGCSEGE